MNKALWLLPVLPVFAVIFFLTKPTEKFEAPPIFVENWEAPAPQPEVQAAPERSATVSEEVSTQEPQIQTAHTNEAPAEESVSESGTVSSIETELPEDLQQTSAQFPEVADLGNS